MIDETTKVVSCFSNDHHRIGRMDTGIKLDPPSTGHPTGQIRILLVFFCGSPELSVMTDALISLGHFHFRNSTTTKAAETGTPPPSSGAAQPLSDRNLSLRESWFYTDCNWEPLNLVPVLAQYLQRGISMLLCSSVCCDHEKVRWRA